MYEAAQTQPTRPKRVASAGRSSGLKPPPSPYLKPAPGGGASRPAASASQAAYGSSHGRAYGLSQQMSPDDAAEVLRPLPSGEHQQRRRPQTAGTGATPSAKGPSNAAQQQPSLAPARAGSLGGPRDFILSTPLDEQRLPQYDAQADPHCSVRYRPNGGEANMRAQRAAVRAAAARQRKGLLKSRYETYDRHMALAQMRAAEALEDARRRDPLAEAAARVGKWLPATAPPVGEHGLYHNETRPPALGPGRVGAGRSGHDRGGYDRGGYGRPHSATSMPPRGGRRHDPGAVARAPRGLLAQVAMLPDAAWHAAQHAAAAVPASPQMPGSPMASAGFHGPGGANAKGGGGGHGGQGQGGYSAARYGGGGGGQSGVPPNDSAVFGTPFVRRMVGLFESKLRAPLGNERTGGAHTAEAEPAEMHEEMHEVEKRLFVAQTNGEAKAAVAAAAMSGTAQLPLGGQIGRAHV